MLPPTRSHDPAQLVIYFRPTPGQGQFSALPTTYDSVAQHLRVTTTQMGEFIFAYPDLVGTPPAPLIVKPPSQSTVDPSCQLASALPLEGASPSAFVNAVASTGSEIRA